MGQVESELEARFLKVLEDWARLSSGAVTFVRGGVVSGKKVADLHVDLHGGTVAHWQVTLQNTIDGTIPDVFKRVDGAPLRDVYLDGYSPRQARPEPARGRRRPAARLRAEGHVVFQLDWDDVDAVAGEHGASREPVAALRRQRATGRPSVPLQGAGRRLRRSSGACSGARRSGRFSRSCPPLTSTTGGGAPPPPSLASFLTPAGYASAWIQAIFPNEPRRPCAVTSSRKALRPPGRWYASPTPAAALSR